MAKEKEKEQEKSNELIPENHPVSEGNPIEGEDFSDYEKMESEELVADAEYWDFKEHPIFVGIPNKIEYDKEEIPRLLCKSVKTGMNWLIPGHMAVIQAVQMDITNDQGEEIQVLDANLPVKFEYLGKIETKNNKSYNRWNIAVLRPQK